MKNIEKNPNESKEPQKHFQESEAASVRCNITLGAQLDIICCGSPALLLPASPAQAAKANQDEDPHINLAEDLQILQNVVIITWSNDQMMQIDLYGSTLFLSLYDLVALGAAHSKFLFYTLLACFHMLSA